MGKQNCDICGGRRIIRLPVLSTVLPRVSDYEGFEAATLQESSREFPCPQCAPTTTEERVEIIDFGSELSAQYTQDPSALEYIRRSLARSIANLMVSKGHVSPWRMYGNRDMSRYRGFRGVSGWVVFYARLKAFGASLGGQYPYLFGLRHCAESTAARAM